MRAHLLTLIVAAGICTTLFQPFAGILLWHWLSLMNPHRMTWGFTFNLQMILAVAATTLVAWIVSREPKRLPISAPTVFLLGFTAWISIGTLFAQSPEPAFEKWDETIRALLMIFVTLALTTTRQRINALIWVIAISVGFYGIKGGVFSIMTGGNYKIFGPEGTFFQDNNACGLALIMVWPLWLYLAGQATNKWLRAACLGAAALIVIAILMTYSRGALVGFMTVGSLVWFTSRRKLAIAVASVVAIVIAIPMIPDRWFDRMNTIENYEDDTSALSRLRQWHLGTQLALDHPLFGGGFKAFMNPQVNDRYTPIVGPGPLHEAHSIYFQVLGEQGLVGFFWFAGVGLSSIFTALATYRRSRARPELAWANRLAKALFFSLAGFATSGAFLSLAYFDLYYLLVVMIISLCSIVTKTLRAGNEAAHGAMPNFANRPDGRQNPAATPPMLGGALGHLASTPRRSTPR